MNEDNRPRYKEQIDVGPEESQFAGGEGSHAGRTNTNRETKSKKARRNGRAEAWIKSGE